MSSNKTSLTIRLTESVVFLRTADRTSRRHLVQADSPPSMVRGLLVLNLAKPTRISSIELELRGKASNNWAEGIGSRRFEATEDHIAFSAKTVFFSAASTQASRRTASVGPGIIHDEDHHLEWEDDNTHHNPHHDREWHYNHEVAYEDDTVTPRNGPIIPGTRHPDPPSMFRMARRISLDNAIFQREFISHHEQVHPIPPSLPASPTNAVPIPNSPSSTRTHNPSSPVPSRLENRLQHASDQPRHGRSRSVLPSPSSSRSLSVETSLNEPGPSRRSDANELPAHSHRSWSSSSRSRSRSQSRPPDRTRDPPGYHEDSNSLPAATNTVAHQDARGRQTSRFSLTGISNALFAIGERARSSSRNFRTDLASANVGDQWNGRGKLGRFGLGELLGLDADERRTFGDGWKEFKKGTYTYPISFTVPGDSPPTLKCDFGHVTWRLKAHVHRPGAFRTKLTASREVTVISYPVQDDTEEQSTIVVERQWESQMHYIISVAARMFHIGGTVPIQFTFMPLAKIKIHRLLVTIEERVDYYTQMQRAARTDPIKRIELLSVKQAGKDGGPILPLDSDDVEVFRNSPLYIFFSNPDDYSNMKDDQNLSEMASNLMGPGPWSFGLDLKLPNSCSQMRFTNKNKMSNISVTHALKVVIRVERGDDMETDPKTGKKKQFDIIVATPISILSCRCSPEWTSLPGYSESFQENPEASSSCPCTMKRQNGTAAASGSTFHSLSIPRNEDTSAVIFPASPSSAPSPSSPVARRLQISRTLEDFASQGSYTTQTASASSSSPDTSPDRGAQLSTSPAGTDGRFQGPVQRVQQGSACDTLLYRNDLFERLVAGQVSESGEVPPTYSSVISAD